MARRLLLLLWLGWPVLLAAEPLLDLPSRGVVTELKSHSQIRFDAASVLSIEDVLAEPGQFEPFEASFDQSASAGWLKLALKAPADSDGQYVLRVSRRFFQRFDLYAPDSQGQLARRSAAIMAPIDAEIIGREFVFDLRLPPGEVTPILLYVDIHQGSFQPLQMAVQDANSFAHTRAVTYLIFGLTLGILLALIFHNLALYLNLRQAGHLRYVLAMTSLLLLLGVDSGLLPNYLMSDAHLPWLAQLNVFLAALMVLTIFYFFRTFADADRLVPRWMMAGRAIVLVLVVMAIVQWFAPQSIFPYLAIGTQLVNVLMFALLMVSAWFAGRRGSVEGYVFLLAWSVFVFSAFGRTLLSLDMTRPTLLLEYAMYFGAVAEASILGLGLAYRVRQLYESHALALKEQHRASRLANLDPLTGAYNRRFLQTYLHNALNDTDPPGHKRAVLILDLDHFKETNDLHGHVAGDRLLRELVTRCQAMLAEGDVLCRLGGDEFVIVTAGHVIDRGLPLAWRIVRDIQTKPFEYNGKSLPVTTSIGVVSPIKRKSTVGAVLRMADQALYEAKRSGRNRAVLFDSRQAMSSDSQSFRQSPPPGERY